MILESNDFDRSTFDAATNGKWAHEALETFMCDSCKTLFLGVPDCHIAFTNPDNLKETIIYNLPRKPICPMCNRAVYDPKFPNHQIEVSKQMFLESGWARLFPQKCSAQPISEKVTA